MVVDVTLDLTAAESALDFLRDLEAGRPPEALARHWPTVVDSGAYHAWLKAASRDPQGALACLREAVPGRTFPRTPRMRCAV